MSAQFTQGKNLRRLWKTQRKTTVMMLLLIPIMSISLYAYLGSSTQLARYEEITAIKNNPEKIIARLEKHLQTHPNSAEGWYLLGRLYYTQHHKTKAKQAFLTYEKLTEAEAQS